MSNELYTIDKTPSTDLEKFQALRIEALEKEGIERRRKLLVQSRTRWSKENGTR